MAIILINYNTRQPVPAVMRVISDVKAITLAEVMAPLHKTRIVVPADVIELTAAVFDSCE